MPGNHTPAEREQFQTRALEVIALGYSQTSASAHIGVSRSTWFGWMQDEDFADAVRDASALFEAREVLKVAQAAKGWQAHAWLLERRFPREYGQHRAIEMTGPDRGPIVIEGVARRIEDVDDAKLTSLLAELDQLLLEAGEETAP